MFRVMALSLLLAALAGCGGSKGSSTTIVINNPASTQQPTRVYRVPSGSMEPAYGIGARVVVKEGSPKVGAVVIFHPPEGAEQEECGPTSHVIKLGGAACSEPIPQEDTGTTFIKRVVAGPGDEIYIKEGHVYRKSARLVGVRGGTELVHPRMRRERVQLPDADQDSGGPLVSHG